MLARITHILPVTNIRRQRTLPVNGKVVVRAGQRVSSGDIIAEARLVTSHMLLDVARGLGVPADKADKLVQRSVGEHIAEDDIIAGPVGMFARTVRAPVDARVMAVGGGQVLLEMESAAYELKAGISGTVTELIPDRGAVIETNGALIQGVWGNNCSDAGLLMVLARSPEEELTAERLDVSMRGAVILGGHIASADTLKMALDASIRALVLASITPELEAQAAAMPIPVILLEGFGRLAISPATYKLLTTSDKREVCVDAATWNRYTNTRPEIIIPLPTSGQVPVPRETDIFAPGQVVRVVQAPYKGVQATLVSLRPGLTAFPSGVRAAAGVLRLENGEQITVPLANLDIIE